MTVIHKPNLVDAKQMGKDFPDSFHYPGPEELQLIGNGDFIKICAHAERFWVEVDSVKGKRITGRVANNLLDTDLEYAELIVCHMDNVYEVMFKDDDASIS